MGVTVGSARIDENGRATGGKAGDQTGKEVSTQAWYKHAKGWIVLRPKDAAKGKLIAECMRAACANSNIGYDQNQRNTLYNLAKSCGFDAGKVKTQCETDCSALTRVCCAYAGIMAKDYNTVTQADALMATGQFDKLTDAKYTEKSDYLRTGDILVTKIKGHTVVVLNDGSKASTEAPTPSPAPSTPSKLGYRILKHGMSGDDVKELQTMLKQLKYFNGTIGGNYLDITQSAAKAFQRDNKLVVDGEYGPKTHAALMEVASGSK